MEEQLNKKALKSGGWYAISNLIMRSVSIFTAPLFTRILTPGDYGAVSNFTAWQNMIVIFTGLGLTYSIGRAKIDYSEKFDSYLSSIQFLAAIVTGLFCIASFALQTYLSKIMNLDGWLISLLFLYLIFYPAVDYMQIKYRYEFCYKQNIIISLLNTVGTVFFSLLFIWIFRNQRWIGRIFGMLITSFVLGLYYFIRMQKKGNCKVNLEYWKYALKISIPMIPHAFAMVVLNQIDRIQIMEYCGDSDAGIYSFGYSYAVLISLVINAVCQAWTPWQYEKHSQGNIKDIYKVSKSITLCMCGFTLIFVTLGPEAIKLLGTQSFWESKWVVAPVALGTLFQFYYILYSGVEIYYKKTVGIGICSVLAALVNYILNTIFIPRYGYLAAAYTTMAGYFLLMVLHFIMYRIVCRDRLFPDFFLFSSALAAVIGGIIVTLFYENYIVRYGFALIMILAIWRYIKQVIKTQKLTVK